MAKIYLLRHGRTQHDGCFVGVTESELAQSGVDDIRRLKKPLSTISFSHVYCSPRKRCLQTASLLGYDERIEIVDGLKEVDFGKWEGLNFKEASIQDPGVFQKLVDNPLACVFPSGQSMEAFSLDVQLAVEDRCVKDIGLNEKILIICHGGVMRVLLCYLLGLPPKRLNAFSVEPGKYAVIDYMPGTGVLEGLNLITDSE